MSWANTGRAGPQGLAREWVDILEVTELSEVTQLEKGVYYLVPASPDTFPAKVSMQMRQQCLVHGGLKCP